MGRFLNLTSGSDPKGQTLSWRLPRVRVRPCGSEPGFRFTGLIAALAIAVAPLASAAPQISEADILTRLSQIRSMQAPASEPAAREQNRTLDNAWRFFGDNKPASLPVLRRELSAELRKPQP